VRPEGSRTPSGHIKYGVSWPVSRCKPRMAVVLRLRRTVGSNGKVRAKTPPCLSAQSYCANAERMASNRCIECNICQSYCLSSPQVVWVPGACQQLPRQPACASQVRMRLESIESYGFSYKVLEERREAGTILLPAGKKKNRRRSCQPLGDAPGP
jgi:hypothetical protein